MLTMQMRFRLTKALFVAVIFAAPLYAMNGAAKQVVSEGSSSLVSAGTSPSVISAPAPQIANAGSGGIAAVAVVSVSDGKESKAPRAASSTDGDIEAIKKAAEDGDLDAIVDVGFRLLRHDKDTEAIACFERVLAASKDEKCSAVIRANYCLGVCYGGGRGVGHDSKKAVSHLVNAADYHALACNRLGEHCEDGDGIPRDLKAAYACYVKAMDIAAKEGGICMPAVINRARCLLDGIGCEIGVDAAQLLLEKAQEKRFEDATVCLAYCAENGIGVSFESTADVVLARTLAKALYAAAKVRYTTDAEGKAAVADICGRLERSNFGLRQMKCGLCRKPFVNQDGTIQKPYSGCCFSHFHRVCAHLWFWDNKMCPGCGEDVETKTAEPAS